VADVSYTPTFHHTDWANRVDRVVAGGPNGFNRRYREIERDLRAVSTVVATVAAKIAQIHVPDPSPPNQQQRIAFTPAFQPVDDGNDPSEWFPDDQGLPHANIGRHYGLFHLSPPAGVRLTSLRLKCTVVGPTDPQPQLRVSLFRVPLRLLAGPVPAEEMSTVESRNVGELDLVSLIPENKGVVDFSTYRYFIDAFFDDPPPNEHNASLTSFELAFENR
jgi:hypothetical protein